MNNTFDLLAQLSGSENKVTTEKLYIMFMGNNHAHGAILSQLIFWTPKARVPGGWIAKTYDDWYDEVVVTERQVRQARKKLEEKGVLETKVKKFNSNPTVHYKLNKKKLVDSILTFCKERNLHNVRNETYKMSETTNRRILQKNTNIKEREETPAFSKNNSLPLKDSSSAQREIISPVNVQTLINEFHKLYGSQPSRLLDIAMMRVEAHSWPVIVEHLKDGYLDRTTTTNEKGKQYRSTPLGYFKNQKWINDPNPAKVNISQIPKSNKPTQIPR